MGKKGYRKNKKDLNIAKQKSALADKPRRSSKVNPIIGEKRVIGDTNLNERNSLNAGDFGKVIKRLSTFIAYKSDDNNEEIVNIPSTPSEKNVDAPRDSQNLNVSNILGSLPMPVNGDNNNDRKLSQKLSQRMSV